MAGWPHRRDVTCCPRGFQRCHDYIQIHRANRIAVGAGIVRMEGHLQGMQTRRQHRPGRRQIRKRAGHGRSRGQLQGTQQCAVRNGRRPNPVNLWHQPADRHIHRRTRQRSGIIGDQDIMRSRCIGGSDGDGQNRVGGSTDEILIPTPLVTQGRRAPTAATDNVIGSPIDTLVPIGCRVMVGELPVARMALATAVAVLDRRAGSVRRCFANPMWTNVPPRSRLTRP